MFLKLLNWRKYRRILKQECPNLPRFLCTASLSNISTCLFWLKMFLYTRLPPNKKISLSSVMEPCVNPSTSSTAHWASASIGLTRYGTPNSWRSSWGRGEKITFVAHFCNSSGGEGGKCHLTSEYKTSGKGRQEILSKQGNKRKWKVWGKMDRKSLELQHKIW